MKLCGFVSALLVLFIAAVPAKLLAWSGDEVVQNAERYEGHTWTCHSWNARTENQDDDVTTFNWQYPFFEAGEPLTVRSDGVTVTASGQVVGVAYCMSHRDHYGEFSDDAVDFSDLLAIPSPSPTYQAGQVETNHQLEFYAGIDCTGLVANCFGLPMIVKTPTPSQAGSRSKWGTVRRWSSQVEDAC